MKKTYMMPTTVVVECGTEGLVCTSGVTGDNGLTFGGVDEDGIQTPASRVCPEEQSDILGLPF